MNFETVRDNLFGHVGRTRSGDPNLQLHRFTQDGLRTGQDCGYAERVGMRKLRARDYPEDSK
jgi:hypothetical protein